MSNTRLVHGVKRARWSICGVLGGAGLAVVFFEAPAVAADLPPGQVYKAPVVVAAPSWTGFYAGLGFGSRSSTGNPTVTGLGDSFGATLASLCNGAANTGGCVTSEPVNDSAFRISPYVGFNWQIAPQWVVGVEGDVGFANRNTTLGGMQYPLTDFILGPPSEAFTVKTTWDASARLRLGVLADPTLLLYVTGGPAWMHIESSSTCSTDPAVGNCVPPNGLSPSTVTHATNKLGWTVGGGAEAMLSANWFVRGEYRYADFGAIGNSDTRANALGVVNVSYDVPVKTHTATLGLAYRFWGDSNTVPGSVATSPRTAVSSWGGLYAGLGAGFRSTRTDVTVTANPYNCVAGGGCVLGQPLNDTAARVSPYLGWNWQFAPQWLAGIEGDFGFSDKTTSLAGMYYPITRAGFNGTADEHFSVRTGWDASARGRLGFLATPSTLLYATGGGTWLRVESQSACSTNAFVGACRSGVLTPSVITNASTKLGWTMGGGFETRLWQNWLVRTEYRYADYGHISNTNTRSLNFLPNVELVSYDTRVRTHTLTFGLAYQFDPTKPVMAKF